MSAPRRYPEAEPTLYDVIEAMQAGFSHMEDQIKGLRSDMDFGLEEVKQNLVEVKDDLRDIRRTAHALLIKDEDKEDTLLNHEERIVSIELWKGAVGKQGFAGA